MRPFPRPVIFRAVESGGAHPVLQRQLMAVADAQPALFGAVDEEEAAEGPERLAADIRGVLLIDDQDAAAAIDQLARRDQPGQPRSHHDHVSVRHEIPR